MIGNYVLENMLIQFCDGAKIISKKKQKPLAPDPAPYEMFGRVL